MCLLLISVVEMLDFNVEPMQEEHTKVTILTTLLKELRKSRMEAARLQAPISRRLSRVTRL